MKIDQQHETFLRTPEEVTTQVNQQGSLSRCTIQGLNLHDLPLSWDLTDLSHLTVIGCEMEEWLETYLRKRGVLIFPAIEGLPYDPFRSDLYQWQELMAPSSGSRGISWDEAVYEHFSRHRFNPGLREALYQRIHDHAMDDGLRRYLQVDDDGMTARRGVGIMGGHSTGRDQASYRMVAQTARLLSREGFLVVSGGGPGIMEAANLGAYLGDLNEQELDEVIRALAVAPGYQDKGYSEAAREVLASYPAGKDSLAIPTWFYGHEPSNLFASAIAKYFSNSLREDNLLAISLYGVIFAPGSAGTTQEIFQDAAQNHYGTYGYISPMVFAGKQRYEQETRLFEVVKSLAGDLPYRDMMFLSDEPEEILEIIRNHPPLKRGS